MPTSANNLRAFAREREEGRTGDALFKRTASKDADGTAACVATKTHRKHLSHRRALAGASDSPCTGYQMIGCPCSMVMGNTKKAAKVRSHGQLGMPSIDSCSSQSMKFES